LRCEIFQKRRKNYIFYLFICSKVNECNQLDFDVGGRLDFFLTSYTIAPQAHPRQSVKGVKVEAG